MSRTKYIIQIIRTRCIAVMQFDKSIFGARILRADTRCMHACMNACYIVPMNVIRSVWNWLGLLYENRTFKRVQHADKHNANECKINRFDFLRFAIEIV